MKLYYATSYKGGTGRSVAVLNLAYHLYRRGCRVVLVDLDLYAPSLFNICNFVDPRTTRLPSDLDRYSTLSTKYTLSKYLQEDAGDPFGTHCEQLTTKNGPLYERKYRANGSIWLYPSGYLRDPHNVDYRPIPGRLDRFLMAVNERQRPDYVICDLSSGVSPLTQAILSQSDDVLTQYKTAWLVFCRFTPQQFAGLTQLLGSIGTPIETSRDTVATPPRTIHVVETAQPTLTQQNQSEGLFAKVSDHSEAVKDQLRDRWYVKFSQALSFEISLLLVEGVISPGYPYSDDIEQLTSELL